MSTTKSVWVGEKVGLQAVLFVAAAWLVSSRGLPLEAEVVAAWGPAWFMLKTAGQFAALLPVLFGWGLVPMHFLRRVARWWQAPGEKHAATVLNATAVTFWLNVLATLILGVAMIGWLNFVLGLAFAPTWSGALILAGFGYLSAGMHWWFDAFEWRSGWYEQRRRWHLPTSRSAALLVIVVWAAYLVRATGTFFFQGHEDAYVYHLSLAEAWIQRGHTGVILTNIYSGYALAVEHYYLFLKLLVRGNAEQNALAQMSHAGIGYGTCVAALLVLGEEWLRPRERSAFMLVCLHTWLIFFMLLPKNDAFLAASILLALVGLVRELPLFFLVGASIAMIMKPTAGISFVALGAAVLIDRSFRPEPGRRILRELLLLATGAALMVLIWAPFGWYNTLVTRNPFFPLLGELFTTPYAPLLHGVVAEAEPFHVTPLGLLMSIPKVLTSDAMLTLSWCLIAASLGVKQARVGVARFFRRPEVRPTLIFIFLAFVLLQLITGEYGKHVEPRHYLAVLGPLLLFAVSALFSGWRDLPRRGAHAAAIAFVALIGVGYSNLDVALRDLYRGLSARNLTQAFLAKKPSIELNDYLSKSLPMLAVGAAEPRVYAQTLCNASYFLPNVEFWHPKESYPAWTWNVETLPAADLIKKLEEEQVRYIIADKGSPLATALSATPAAKILKGVSGNPPVALWQLQ